MPAGPPVSAAEPAGSAAPSTRQGRVIAGRYRLLELIGRGAMGEVWRTRDDRRRTDVALKFLTLPREGQVIDAMERFRFEAQVAAHLGTKTDLIVAVRDVGEDPAIGPFLVMDWVRGGSLRQLITEHGPMSPAAFAPLLTEIAKALSVAHSLGIVHRDIKPTNVLITEGRHGRLRAKVTDFGIAKWIRQDLPADFPNGTAEGIVLGTPAYLSPEHVTEGYASPHSDMWALAIVTYEVLTGQRPFAGRTMADVLSSVLAGERPPVTTLCPEAPPELEAWFVRAFALDPAERFSSVEQMVTAYCAAINVSGVRPRPERSARGARRVVLAALAGALALGGAAAVLKVAVDVPAAATASEGVASAASRLTRAVRAADAPAAATARATAASAASKAGSAPAATKAAAGPAAKTAAAKAAAAKAVAEPAVAKAAPAENPVVEAASVTPAPGSGSPAPATPSRPRPPPRRKPLSDEAKSAIF